MPNVRTYFLLPQLLLITVFLLGLASPTQSMANAAPSSTSLQNPKSGESQADVYRSLANLIENPETRDKLIEELNNLSDNADKQNGKESSNSEKKAEDKKSEDSLAAAIAEQSQSVVQTMMSTLKGSWDAITSIWTGSDKTTQGWFKDLITTAIVAAATILSFIIFRILARFIFRSTNNFAMREHSTHAVIIKVTAVIIATIVDIAVVALAWLAGYGVAQAMPGPLFSFSGFLGGSQAGAIGGVVAVIAVFLPGTLLVFAGLPWWRWLGEHRRAMSALAGVHAGVVGLLLAALYDPVWTSAVHSALDLGLVLVLWLCLAVWRVPVWLLAPLSALGGVILLP